MSLRKLPIMGRDEVEVNKNGKKDEANIQPFWPNKPGTSCSKLG